MSKPNYFAAGRYELQVISLQLDDEPLVDVFAYRGYIYGWNFENEFLVYSVQSLMDELGSAYGELGLSAAYALFCSRGIGASAQMKTAFRSRNKDIDEVLRLQQEPLVRAKHPGGFQHVIDMRITYDRIYLATESGLFIGSLKPQQLAEERLLPSRMEREGECLAVNTGMRAIGASFGEEGLLVIANESEQTLGPRKDWFLPVKSVRSSLGASTLANFPSQEEMQRIPVAVTRLRRAVSLIDVAVSDVEASNLPTYGSNSYLLWDSHGRRLFDVGEQRKDIYGDWFTGPIDAEDVGEVDEGPKVISAAFTGNYYLAIEREDGVSLIGHGEERLLQTGPTISMRTYRNSWRYRRLVTTTSADGVAFHAGLDGYGDRP